MDREGLFWVGTFGGDLLHVNKAIMERYTSELCIAEDLSYEEAAALCKACGAVLDVGYTRYETWRKQGA